MPIFLQFVASRSKATSQWEKRGKAEILHENPTWRLDFLFFGISFLVGVVVDIFLHSNILQAYNGAAKMMFGQGNCE